MYTIPDWAHTAPDFTDKKAFSAYQKALTDDVTPLSLDTENGTAEFEGKHGHYAASLEGCPCGARPKPCKHMYRIAMELGIMPGKPASNTSKVIARQATHEAGVTSGSVRRTMQGLDHDALSLLDTVACHCLSNGKMGGSPILVLRTPAVAQLVNLGLAEETIGDYLHCGLSIGKEGIRDALHRAGLDAPEKMFRPNARWAKIHEHLQSLYESNPDAVSSAFALLDGTAVTYDKANVIRREADHILYPRDDYTQLFLF